MTTVEHAKALGYRWPRLTVMWWRIVRPNAPREPVGAWTLKGDPGTNLTDLTAEDWQTVLHAFSTPKPTEPPSPSGDLSA